MPDAHAETTMVSNIARHLHPYSGETDLAKVLLALGEWNALCDGCGYMHPGDICHYLSNILRGQDTGPYLFLYEEDDARLTALVVLYPPRFQGYDVLIDPRRRTAALETALLTWAEARMWALMQAAGVATMSLGSDAMDCDSARCALLRELGYASTDEPYYWYTIRSLEMPIPTPTLPDGFAIRAVADEQEAAALGEVHSSAFASSWPGTAYLPVMRSPAYRLGRELVVCAPDGQLAAFLVYWCDPISRSGLFEPVGCHKDFQRRGLTRALMYEGLQQMRAQGMLSAIVKYEADNPAAAALYAAVGFQPKYALVDHQKTGHP